MILSSSLVVYLKKDGRSPDFLRSNKKQILSAAAVELFNMFQNVSHW